MKALKTLIIVTALVAGGGVAVAGSYGGHERDGCRSEQHGMNQEERAEKRLARMTEKLGLTESQQQAIQAIRSEAGPERERIRAAMKENRAALKSLVTDSGASEADIRRLADQQGELMADAIVLRARMKQEMDAVLTDEQRQKAHAWHRERHAS